MSDINSHTHENEKSRIMPEYQPDIDAEISNILDNLESLNSSQVLLEAVKYSVLQGGKRLRPRLVLASCQAIGGDIKNALPACVAIEMIHAFSLVHDDLPALDNDDLRRGKPTCHKKYGEAMAIIAGDALATLPYLVIGNEIPDPDTSIKMINELSKATIAMIVGQSFDTLGNFAPGETSQQKLNLIHRNKTGALIRAACRLGAVAGKCSPVQLQLLTSYGESIGLMFQIVDDILDITQTPEHIGKHTNKDVQAGKLTYPEVFGLEKSRQIVDQLKYEAHQSIQTLGKDAQELIDICEYLVVRTK